MKELLDPRNDFVFKRIFGSEENKDVLLAFLNRIFANANEPALTEIVLLNPYTDKDSPLDKQSIFDIWAKTEEGRLINVEMQLINKYDIEKRTLYYWSKRYSAQLQEGEPYKQLKKCVMINILNYSIMDNDSYHHIFHLREDRTGLELCDDIEIHFLELPKLDVERISAHGGLMNWLIFLKAANQEKWEALWMNEPKLKKAMDALAYLSQDEEARWRYEARQKFLHDEASMIERATEMGVLRGIEQGWEQGIEKGLQQGLEQGIEKGLQQGLEQGELKKATEIALNMLSLGLDAAVVAKASGLTLAEVELLRSEHLR